MPEIGRFRSTSRHDGSKRRHHPGRLGTGVHDELQRRATDAPPAGKYTASVGIALETALAHVADDADDFGRRVALAFPKHGRPPERILAGP